MFYGRSEADWERLAAEGQDHLEDLAAHRADTSYGEMNTELNRRTGLRPFDLDQPGERKAMGELLGQISEASYAAHGVLISALVHHQDSDPGRGFYDLAERKDLIPAACARWRGGNGGSATSPRSIAPTAASQADKGDQPSASSVPAAGVRSTVVAGHWK